MASAALTLPLIALVAALRTGGFRLVAWTAGLGTMVFGAASAWLPEQASSPGVAWGAVAVLGGALFIAVAEIEARRDGATERYLAAALRSIPQRQRADVEGELRSGDPARLAAEYAGRPLHLIGPELYLVYRNLLLRLVGIVVPIVFVVLVAVESLGGESYANAMIEGTGGALTIGVHLFFWVTLLFAFLERADAARDARSEILGKTGQWTVDNAAGSIG